MNRWLTFGGAVVAGAVPGLVMAGPGGAIIGGTVGIVLGAVADRLAVRSFVTLAVVAGTSTGAFIGAAIAEVLCLPSSCPGAEWVAGAVTGVGALIGVGMIAALATRSFDEHRDAVAANRPPPTTGCNPGEDCAE